MSFLANAKPITEWPRRLQWLFVVLGFTLMVAGIWWAVHGGWRVWLGVVAMSVSTPMVGYGCRTVSPTETGPMTRAERRFLREFSIVMPVYFVLVIVLWSHARTLESGWLRGLVAVSPTFPVAWLVWATTRMILDSDELMQRIHLQALSIAAGVVSVVSMALGFLAAARVIHLDGAILLWVFPVLAWVYGGLRWWLTRRMRGE